MVFSVLQVPCISNSFGMCELEVIHRTSTHWLCLLPFLSSIKDVITYDNKGIREQLVCVFTEHQSFYVVVSLNSVPCLLLLWSKGGC